MQAGPVHQQEQAVVWNREDEVSGLPRFLGATPEPASTRTYTLTQVRPKSQSQISPKQYLLFWRAVNVPDWKEREKKKGRKKKKHRTEHKEMSKQAAAHTTQPCRREKRAARRQYQHRFCSHRSAGNYDNNVFPRQPLSDLVSEHLPFLKSPPDNIWYDYKVKILFKERPLMCL